MSVAPEAVDRPEASHTAVIHSVPLSIISPALHGPTDDPSRHPLPRQERLKPDQDWALFLDIDGTLLRKIPDPRDVVVDDALRELLARVDTRLDGALAFVSGRRLAAIKEMMGRVVTHAAGLYGLEFQWAGSQIAASTPEPPPLRDLAREVTRLFAREPGLVVERKGPVLSLNTGRRADLLSIIQPLAERTVDALPAGYRIVVGHAGLEVLPPAADKGAAIRRFMSLPPFKGRRPIFIGDDKPDEQGFAAVNALNGISVRVLPAGETIARHGLEDVDAVREWLDGAAFPNAAALAPIPTPAPRT